MKTLRPSLTALLCILSFFVQAQPHDPLVEGFKNPPPSAKARTWWHWMNGNISKAGITSDLEAMKAVGIQEAQIFNVKLNEPKGPITYMSEPWLDHFKFAAQEARRLGMALGFHNSAGWSSSGGPWMAPEHAMQTVVFSETIVTGGRLIDTQLSSPKTNLDYYQDIAVVAFPKPQDNRRIDNLDYKSLSGRVRNHLQPDTQDILASAIIEKSTIVNLTSALLKDGSMKWNAPSGEWVILRIGHTPKGTTNHPSPSGGHGLECDKMSKTAVDAYWNGGVQPILDALGELAGTVVNNCIIDSYEVGTTNWTPGFDQEFKKLRGYDLTSYLPTLAGYYVESGEVSERFLWDFRRTIGDLIAENYYGRFGELCHEAGLTFSVEPYWGPFDNMQVGATGDIVMCEFWSGLIAFFDSPKFVASIAKLNGSSIVGAESFTGIGGWSEHPATIKAIGDKAWTQGINRFIYHSYVHQPWEVAPGLTLSYHGLDFNRHNTWFQSSKSYLEYIARSQFLLQQGKSVADVLVFTGESSPNDALLIPEIKSLGFDYDLIGVNKLHTLFVKEGQIYTENGDSYRAFVLPESTWMRPETLRIIADLVDSGATIFGTKPKKSPSLKDYPTSDDQVASLAQELWASRKVHDQQVLEYLKKGTVPPDFSTEENSGNMFNFIHRRMEQQGIDLFFIASADKTKQTAQCTFRVSGKQPELWNAKTGQITVPAVWKENPDGTTSIPVSFEPEGSVFVVFRDEASNVHLTDANFKLTKPKAAPLANLEIVQAAYGSFLPLGLQDVTDLVRKEVKGHVLDIQATRMFCDCDPAPGYIKEMRIEYLIGDEPHYTYASEREQIFIDAGKKTLTIQKAVFGKFERGVKQVPEYFPTFDVTDKIKNFINQGIYEIQVSDRLVDENKVKGNRKELKISYRTNDLLEERTVPEGRSLTLYQDTPLPKLVQAGKDLKWITPYPGTLTYSTASGKTKKMNIKSVPASITFGQPWKITFPGGATQTVDELISWHTCPDDQIKYFSGTATYRNKFELSEKQIKAEGALELDLGHVAVIAQVIVNEKEVGTLWKKPFRINIEDFVQAGTNTLAVNVTNLLPNRLIGDEQLPLDYERQRDFIGEWPEWLINGTPRPSARVTLSGWKHYKQDSELFVSGLLGPVVIRAYAQVKMD